MSDTFVQDGVRKKMLKKTTQKETDFTDSDYFHFRELIRTKSGIYFSERKRADLKNGVLKAFHYSGLPDLQQYFDALSSSPANSAIFKTLISFLTVGETYFFRHFDVLEKEIIPRIIRAHQHDKMLRIWSAGCSTGEEPFSVAMVLHHLLADLREWTILIIGTDINVNSLQYAREGVYRPWSLRSISDAYKAKYFHRKDGLYYLDDRIRSMVKFDYLNLVDECYPSSENQTKELDMVFCRNVTIYFEAETTIKVVNRFFECLKEKSYLAVGHAEPSSLIYDAYVTEIYPDAVVYRKDASAKKDSQYKTGIKIRSDLFRHYNANQNLRSAEAPQKLEVLQKQVDKLKPKVKGVDVGQTTPTSVRKKLAELSAELGKTMLPPAMPYQETAQGAERRKEATETEMFGEAIRLFYEKNFRDAESLFLNLVERYPGNGRAHYMIAHIYANLDAIKKSKEFCYRAIEHDPLLLEAYYLLGLIYKEENDFENSLGMLRKAIYIDMNFALGYYEMAVNYFKLGDSINGRKHLRQAQRILMAKSADDRIGILDDLTVKELGMMISMWDQ
jgi:chemotaxis protein methyltransferase CheR